jgi:hypothetical protein
MAKDQMLKELYTSKSVNQEKEENKEIKKDTTSLTVKTFNTDLTIPD